jgi:hypothetical protein
MRREERGGRRTSRQSTEYEVGVTKKKKTSYHTVRLDAYFSACNTNRPVTSSVGRFFAVDVLVCVFFFWYFGCYAFGNWGHDRVRMEMGMGMGGLVVGGRVG